MSYPEPRYLGETGEASAVLHPADAPPDLESKATVCRYLATGAATNGQFGLYRWDMPGPVTGPGPHFHRSISESFFILDGTVRLYNGTTWVDASKGDFLFVPEGGIHGFRNESGEPASMLILFAPGAPREPYFEQVASMAGRSEEERAAFFLEHDTFWT
jgi:mannose-6-phosphate isomerase-like protein (cupin superfamily)